MSAAVSSVVDAAGEVSIVGAAPVTVTASLTIASTVERSRPRRFGDVSRIGRATRPSGSTTITSIGIGGVTGHRKRPSRSVRTEPRWPTIVTSAPAIGVPLRESMRRPSIGGAGAGQDERRGQPRERKRATSRA